MYDKSLVAVDHSEISDRAVLAARDLALLSKGEVWVLHLREREVVTKTAVVIADETEDEARSSNAAVVDKLTAAGVKAHGEIRNTLFGYAGREIVDDAIRHDPRSSDQTTTARPSSPPASASQGRRPEAVRPQETVRK